MNFLAGAAGAVNGASSAAAGLAAQGQGMAQSYAAQGQNFAAQGQSVAQNYAAQGQTAASGLAAQGQAAGQNLLGQAAGMNAMAGLLPGASPAGDADYDVKDQLIRDLTKNGFGAVLGEGSPSGDLSAFGSPRNQMLVLDRDDSSALAATAAGLTATAGDAMARARLGMAGAYGTAAGMVNTAKDAIAAAAADPDDAKRKAELKRQADKDKELEKLKVLSMHDMRTTVNLTVGNVPMTCKFIYLTNSAINVMGTNSMRRVAHELGLKDFRQIIRLMPARCGTMGWKACDYWDDKFMFRKTPELGMVEREKSEHQLLLLARHLLKLAVNTNALVIGNDSCALVEAFLRVAAPVQRRYKDACPFKLLIFSRAYMCHMTAESKKETTAGRFRKKCDMWRESKADFEGALKKRYGHDSTWWPRQELYTGEYSMIMFECVDYKSGSLTEQVFLEFQNDFMVAYSHLPSVALQMYGQWKFMENSPTIRDFVEQDGNQLLLLDSRDRPSLQQLYYAKLKKLRDKRKEESKNEEDPKQQEEDPEALMETELNLGVHPDFRWNLPEDLMEQIKDIGPLYKAYEDLRNFASLLHTFEDGAHEGPRMDQYDASALAFVKNQVLELHKDKEKIGDYSEQNKMWLWEAIIRKGQQKDHEASNKDDSSNEKEKKQKELICAARLLMMYLGNEMQWEHRMRHKHCKDCVAKIRSSTTFEELAANLKQGTTGYLFLFHFHQALEKFVAGHSQWFKLVEHDKPTPRGTKEIALKSEDERRGHPQGDDAKGAAEAVAKFLGGEQQKGQKMFEVQESMLDFAADEEKWLAIYDLIASPYVHVGNLHDLKDIEHKLERMAITDRLPAENTMEALVLIRRAWTLVDIFKKSGTQYKWIAKTSYALLLLVGIVIVCITVYSTNSKGTDREVNEEFSADLLLFVALAGSFITGVVTMMDPTRKWLQLRGAQLSLESEIWQFRTRSGEYMSTATMSLGQNEEEHRAATLFKQSMLLTYGKLQQSSGLSDTSFFSMQTTTDDVEDIFNMEHGEDGDNTQNPAALHRSKSTRVAWQKRTKKLEKMEKKVKFLHKQYNPNFIKDLEKMRRDGPNNVNLRPLENEDNFHSPVDSDSYITWRLMPALSYYHSQIPVYFWRRRVFQALILLSSIAVGVFAALGWAEWSAIISSISVALAAWQEFVGYAKKLERYSSVAAALENHLTWWQSLRPTDKLNAQIQNQLVQQTEDLLTSEHSAWMSDAQQAAKMLKNANAAAKSTKPKESSPEGLSSPRGEDPEHGKKE
mmetsp:Transcript_59776/g.142259  ORF Transcript_59776/g.142259 Transcript_59776/m.142259 type:complete len:1275 (+) Transcript_59776:53-3877(+)